MSYAELWAQSHFSFLQAPASPEQLVSTAATLGYQALALTDECSVAGVVRAWRQIRDEKLPLKLIVGASFRYDSSLQLVLLCPDRLAYAELCRLISNSRKRAVKGQYQLDLWDLKSCRYCLVLWLPSGEPAADQSWASWLCRHYAERLYLAQNRLLGTADQTFARHCEQLSLQFQLRRCAVGQVLMATPQQQALLDTMTAIRLGEPVSSCGLQLSANRERCLRPVAKLQQLFSAELLACSTEIASRCTFQLETLAYEYPSELVPAGYSPMQYLRELVRKGAALRFGATVPADIQAQIDHELALIEALDYPYYFLTIADLVSFARQQQILHQGRGSAANSVVCYCLQITAVDPRKISVLFERFISKERDEPPDIDVDFEHERREEVIQYIYRKYGRERAALAATVICYRLRSALRDVGKALGFSLTQLEYWLQQLNRRHPEQSWWQQLGQHGLDLQSHTARLLIELVEQLRGKPRHLSQHVGGFVISAGPLYELVPVENAAMPERTVIQWDKDDLETMKLLKVDVLALGMLTALRKALTLVNQQRSEPLTLASISQTGDDPAVYRQIQQADTIGVFQIESRAQMSMLPRLKPACFYDLVIEIAIVRPGPIQGGMVHPYLRRRDGLEPVSYPSAQTEAVLSRTLGVPIFQEQVIKLAMVAAGFSGGEADQLRRAMGSWKNTGELVQFRDKLLSGMAQRGYSQQYAEQIYAQICGFGEYGFPESHSASFALLAYASAWLKHYYPLEFLTALLNSLPMGFYSASQLIQDGRRHGVTVLPVCIQSSGWDHQPEQTATGTALRLGLRQVKGLRESQLRAALARRPAQGFADISQLKQALPEQAQLEALASSDALQLLCGHRFASRWQLLDRLDELPLFAPKAAPETRPEMRPEVRPETSPKMPTTSQHFHAMVAEPGGPVYRHRQLGLFGEDDTSRQRHPADDINLSVNSGANVSTNLSANINAALSVETHTATIAAALSKTAADTCPASDSGLQTLAHSLNNDLSNDLSRTAAQTASHNASGPVTTQSSCPLPAPTAWQQLSEDYASLGLCLHQHPVALLREWFKDASQRRRFRLGRESLHCANELAALSDGQLVKAIGLVTVRQSPGTAGGVTFVTLEDETGQINLIVWQATALAQQQTFLTSRLWLVHGVLQRQDAVCHLIAGRLDSLDPLLPTLVSSSRDFH